MANGDLWDDDGAVVYVHEDGTLHMRWMDDGHEEPDDDIPRGLIALVLVVALGVVAAVVTLAYFVGVRAGVW